MSVARSGGDPHRLEPHSDLRLTGARTGLREGDVVQVIWRREEGRKVAERVTLK